MKSVPAIIAAITITGIVGLAILAVGASALFNTNTVPVLSSPASASTKNQSVSASQQAQISQLESQIAQYQQREKDYQSRLNQAIQQINDANSQIQTYQSQLSQYQELLVALQNQGLIRITRDGRIFIAGGFSNDSQ